MEYQLFNMCPFTIASVGGGGSFAGVGSESYTWTHSPCLEGNCRLWTYKLDEKGEVYVQGCSLQFIGLNKEEIIKNLEIKNKIITETNEKAERITRGDFCETCMHIESRFLGDSTCQLTGKVIDKKHWCEKFKRY